MDVFAGVHVALRIDNVTGEQVQSEAFGAGGDGVKWGGWSVGGLLVAAPEGAFGGNEVLREQGECLGVIHEDVSFIGRVLCAFCIWYAPMLRIFGFCYAPMLRMFGVLHVPDRRGFRDVVGVVCAPWLWLNVACRLQVFEEVEGEGGELGDGGKGGLERGHDASVEGYGRENGFWIWVGDGGAIVECGYVTRQSRANVGD